MDWLAVLERIEEDARVELTSDVDLTALGTVWARVAVSHVSLVACDARGVGVLLRTDSSMERA